MKINSTSISHQITNTQADGKLHKVQAKAPKAQQTEQNQQTAQPSPKSTTPSVNSHGQKVGSNIDTTA